VNGTIGTIDTRGYVQAGLFGDKTEVDGMIGARERLGGQPRRFGSVQSQYRQAVAVDDDDGTYKTGGNGQWYSQTDVYKTGGKPAASANIDEPP